MYFDFLSVCLFVLALLVTAIVYGWNLYVTSPNYRLLMKAKRAIREQELTEQLRYFDEKDLDKEGAQETLDETAERFGVSARVVAYIAEDNARNVLRI